MKRGRPSILIPVLSGVTVRGWRYNEVSIAIGPMHDSYSYPHKSCLWYRSSVSKRLPISKVLQESKWWSASFPCRRQILHDGNRDWEHQLYNYE